MLIPMSTAYAAIGSMFSSNTSPDSQIVIELALEYTHKLDGLSFEVDGETTVLDESVVHELLFADSSHDNQGSGSVSVSISSQALTDRADWNHVYIDDHARYELTSVSLPAEIRPPIYL